MSDAERRLIVKTAADVRQAITRRAEELQKPLADYDLAMMDDDAERQFGAAVMLVLFSSGLVDLVAGALRKFSEVHDLLKAGENG